MKITKLKLPRKNEIHSYFLAGDWHSFHLCDSSYSILKKSALNIPKKQRKLVINGDFLDCVHLMKKNEEFQLNIKRANGIQEYFLPETEKEFQWGNQILDELQKVFPEIIFVSGNHDWRYNWFMQAHSPVAYRHNFCLKTGLNLKSRNILFVDYNNWLDIGNLSITHGMFHGTSAVKKHFEACGGRSVVFSHVHKLECKPFVCRGETRQSWSLPAMCGLNPEYIKNTENNWSNGFGLAQFKNNGNFNMNIFQIWDNELIWPDGTIIK